MGNGGRARRRFHDLIRISRSVNNQRVCAVILHLISPVNPFAGRVLHTRLIRGIVYMQHAYTLRNADDYIGRPVDRDILHRRTPLFSHPFVLGEGLIRTYVWYVRPYVYPVVAAVSIAGSADHTALCTCTCTPIAHMYEMTRE